MKNLILGLVFFSSFSCYSIIGGEKTSGVTGIYQLSVYNLIATQGKYSTSRVANRSLGTGFFVAPNIMITAAHVVHDLASGKKRFLEIRNGNETLSFQRGSLKIKIPETFLPGGLSNCEGDFSIVTFPQNIAQSWFSFSSNINEAERLEVLGFGTSSFSWFEKVKNMFLYERSLFRGYNYLDPVYLDKDFCEEIECVDEAYTLRVGAPKEVVSINSAYHWKGDSGSPVLQGGKVVGIACAISYTHSKTHNYSYFVNLTHFAPSSFIHLNI